jgi:phosphoserine phosphatase
MDKGEVYIFDVCGTLYASNTTYDFLLYYFKKYDFKKYLMIKLALSFPSKSVLIILSRLGLRWDLRRKLIAYLKNESYDRISTNAINFVRDFLEKKQNRVIHEILLKAQSEKKEILLVSASIHPVVEAIAISLGVKNFLATTLSKNHQNQYTGQITDDLKGNKLKSLIKYHFNFSQSLTIFTDNLDDLQLIEKCEKAIIVSKRRTINFWRSNMSNHPDWELIHA